MSDEIDLTGYEGPERRRGFPPASQAEVADMRLAQEELDRSVRGLHSQLRSLDATLRDFVPRRELETTYSSKRSVALERRALAERRRTVLEVAVFAALVTIHVHDFHIESCRIVDGVTGDVRRPESETSQFLCDAAFPTHPHAGTGPGGDMTPGTIAGTVLYLAFFAWFLTDILKRRRKADELEDRGEK